MAHTGCRSGRGRCPSIGKILWHSAMRTDLFLLHAMNKEREGGGLAVLVLAGFLVLFMLLCGGGATWSFVRQAEMERAEAIRKVKWAEHLADQAAADAQLAAEADGPVSESPDAPQ